MINSDLPAIPRYSYNSFLSPPENTSSNWKFFGLFSLLSFLISFVLLLFVASFFTTTGLIAKTGLLFAFTSLVFGMFFFLYSLKYYLTISLVLSHSREKEGREGVEGSEGKGVLNRVMGMIFGVTVTIEGEGPAGLTDVVAIAAGQTFCLAITTNADPFAIKK